MKKVLPRYFVVGCLNVQYAHNLQKLSKNAYFVIFCYVCVEKLGIPAIHCIFGVKAPSYTLFRC